MKLNLIGQKFNKLTVIAMCEDRTKAKKIKWLCRCDCGRKIEAIGSGLKIGNPKSCGCFRKDPEDITGKVFGSWTVLCLSYEKGQQGKLKWVCKCICGIERAVLGDSLVYGVSKSCGCTKAEITRKIKTTHGQSRRTSEYCAWSSMKNRCLNPNNKDYPYYGGRGISVFKPWIESFEAFYAFMGPKPSRNHSLDRWPNNDTGHYEPGNLRWATRKEQSNNIRGLHWIEYDGQKMIMADWAKYLGWNYDRLRGALKRKSIGEIVLSVRR